MSQKLGHNLVGCSALAPFQGCSRQSGSRSQQMLNSKFISKFLASLQRQTFLASLCEPQAALGSLLCPFGSLISSRTSRESLLSRRKLVFYSMTLIVVGAHPHPLFLHRSQVRPHLKEYGHGRWDTSELGQVFHISLYMYTNSNLSRSPLCRTRTTKKFIITFKVP